MVESFNNEKRCDYYGKLLRATKMAFFIKYSDMVQLTGTLAVRDTCEAHVASLSSCLHKIDQCAPFLRFFDRYGLGRTLNSQGLLEAPATCESEPNCEAEPEQEPEHTPAQETNESIAMRTRLTTARTPLEVEPYLNRVGTHRILLHPQKVTHILSSHNCSLVTYIKLPNVGPHSGYYTRTRS